MARKLRLNHAHHRIYVSFLWQWFSSMELYRFDRCIIAIVKKLDSIWILQPNKVTKLIIESLIVKSCIDTSQQFDHNLFSAFPLLPI
jgi:hypothetical protein